jgi:hypothetical protein
LKLLLAEEFLFALQSTFKWKVKTTRESDLDGREIQLAAHGQVVSQVNSPVALSARQCDTKNSDTPPQASHRIS